MNRAMLATPAGAMVLLFDADRLWLAEFHDDDTRLHRSARRFGFAVPAAASALPQWLAQPFAHYFAGNCAALHDVPLAAGFGSPFEQAVWAQLRRIPAGQTRSYGDIARAVGGQPSGEGGLARAVGTANGRNPLAIVVPCHRVIGADGRLTGYAGGLERKRWLLAHEGALAQPGLL
jgi:methylated-DNA-[protein]-cysteine S-methyltransferase